MKFIDLAKTRYSCRNYKNLVVDKEKIIEVLEAGRVAPSAANFQPWIFYVISEKENREKIFSVYPRPWFKTAPVILIICGNHEISWKRSDGKDHCDIDIAIVTDHITLQLTELGLASCWICNFDKQKLSEILKLEKNIEPMVILSLGYPEDKPDVNRHETKRKTLDSIINWEF